MAEFVIPQEPSRDEIRDYVLDMIAQLSILARDNGDARLAALLERVLATVTTGDREH